MLDEILAENADLTSQVAKLKAELSELRSAAVPDVAAKLKAETARADELGLKLEAANKELGELRGKALDVDKRAAAMVKALGIANLDDLPETTGAQPKPAGSHSPGTWQAEAEKHFNSKQ